jgi:hypothetical protein
MSGLGSSVGIATDYRLDGLGIKSRLELDFSHMSRAALELLTGLERISMEVAVRMIRDFIAVVVGDKQGYENVMKHS